MANQERNIIIMILLRKKRILFIITMIFISIFTYFLGINYNKNTVQTVSLPVTNKVVVLDAGHRTEKMQEHNRKMVVQKVLQI